MKHKIIWFIIYIVAFACGAMLASTDCRLHHMQTYDVAPNTSVDFNITFNCMDAKPITSNGIIDGYFSQCLCMISDALHEPTFWDLESVNHLQYRAQTANAAISLCNAECAKLCNEKISDALRDNPNFQIPTRW